MFLIHFLSLSVIRNIFLQETSFCKKHFAKEQFLLQETFF